MLFNSIAFYLLFLPLALAAFHVARQSGKLWLVQATLITASAIFYAGQGAQFLPLLLGSIGFTWIIALAIDALDRRGNTTWSRPITMMAVCIHLCLLGYFKYRNFFAESFMSMTGNFADLQPLILPLAISFFTFQQIGYVVDVHRRKVEAARNPLDFFLFVAFFPQLIAGPITLYQELKPQFSRQLMRAFQPRSFTIGTALFAIGLLKKTTIADQAAFHTSIVFNAADSGMAISLYDAWVGTLGYTVQIYFDFSGYSDMACGLALMFGLRIPMNFLSPYQAASISEFWRRWHITLSRFLRDYLYIPLGGSREGDARTAANLFVTMLIGGLWHGAGWTFVFWGALHGLYLAVAAQWARLSLRLNFQLPKAICWAITLLAVMIAWVFFRATTFSGALTLITAMFGITPQGEAVDTLSAHWSTLIVDGVAGPWIIVVGLAISLFAPNFSYVLRRYRTSLDVYGHFSNRRYQHPIGLIERAINSGQRLYRLASLPLVLCIFSIVTIAAVSVLQLRDGAYTEFIYFNF